MTAEATELVIADVGAEQPKVETKVKELKIRPTAKTEDTIKIDDAANIEVGGIDEETLEDLYTRRHRTIKIPEEMRDCYLEVKFKNVKRSSHALDKLMEAIRAPVEEEDVKTMKSLYQKWVKNYNELLETEDQTRTGGTHSSS